MSHAWDPNLHSGTAATFIELEDCDLEKGFDASALWKTHEEEKWRGLNFIREKVPSSVDIN